MSCSDIFKFLALRELGNDVWVAEGLCKFLGRFWVPCRMTVLGYDNADSSSGKNLIVCSPFPAEEVLVNLIRNLGTVQFIIAPNFVHHLWVADFGSAFPNAKLIASHSLGVKRKDVKWDALLGPGQDPPAGWPEAVPMKYLPGFDLFEIVLLHKPSKSLICTDIAFNLPPPGSPGNDVLQIWPLNWYLKLSNAYRPCCMSNPQVFLISDAGALKEALTSILEEWDWEQVIVAHGSIITSGAKDAMRAGTYDFVSKVLERQQSPWRYCTAAVAVALGVVAVGVYLRRK